jgi:hypothetical protein
MDILSTVVQYCDAPTTRDLALVNGDTWWRFAALARNRACYRIRRVRHFPRLIRAIKAAKLKGVSEYKTCPTEAAEMGQEAEGVCSELQEDDDIEYCVHGWFIAAKSGMVCCLDRVVCVSIMAMLNYDKRTQNRKTAMRSTLKSAMDMARHRRGANSRYFTLCAVFECDLGGHADEFAAAGLIGAREYVPRAFTLAVDPEDCLVSAPSC